MTEQDLAILDKMVALMEAAAAQADTVPKNKVYREQCFAMIEPQFRALERRLSVHRYYHSKPGYEQRMTAFLLAHRPDTSKWYTDVLQELGLGEEP